ncbi:hypothetical protein [Martelella sp. HB161492]|uniref:hypothetical protein n=1 Tax=Martelella sp. HB161492 TaxID=2720726 RepID=UPI0015900254|nr:hypothetical protein [Martelella sp. HB161492]
MELTRLPKEARDHRFGEFEIGEDFRHAPDRFQLEARLLLEEKLDERLKRRSEITECF